LLAGEAFFDIAPDASRPFVVDVRGIEVKVLGTAFDAQVTSTRTEVALLRGSIEALPGKDGKPSLLMKPGDMLAVEHATGAVTIGKVSTEDIGAWREGKVFIADATVASVVELIQRYHPAWLSLPDRSLASRKVSGLFDLRNPDHALSALVEPFGGKVRSVTPWGRVISRL
jgi:transmembrane sensor